MPLDSVKYDALPVFADDQDEVERPSRESALTKAVTLRRVLLALFISMQIVVDFSFALSFFKPRIDCCKQTDVTSLPALYSPAQDVVSYEIKKFDKSFGKGRTGYEDPPSDKVDQMWEDLYSFGVSRIPKSEARLLPNKTAPIPGDEDNYIMTLDVFHQLHCLNKIRQGLSPSYYLPKLFPPPSNITAEDFYEHNIHCIDSIRQSLMCAADISPIVWQWNLVANKTLVDMGVVHVCRDFNRLVEWAKERELTREFDTAVHIDDDIHIAAF